MLKIRFKNAKMLYIFAGDPRGCDVTAPRGPTRGLRGAYATYTYILFTYFIYKRYSAFRISKGFFKCSKPSHLINATVSLNFFRVGLSPTQFNDCR